MLAGLVRAVSREEAPVPDDRGSLDLFPRSANPLGGPVAKPGERSNAGGQSSPDTSAAAGSPPAIPAGNHPVNSLAVESGTTLVPSPASIAGVAGESPLRGEPARPGSAEPAGPPGGSPLEDAAADAPLPELPPFSDPAGPFPRTPRQPSTALAPEWCGAADSSAGPGGQTATGPSSTRTWLRVPTETCGAVPSDGTSPRIAKPATPGSSPSTSGPWVSSVDVVPTAHQESLLQVLQINGRPPKARLGDASGAGAEHAGASATFAVDATPPAPDGPVPEPMPKASDVPPLGAVVAAEEAIPDAGISLPRPPTPAGLPANIQPDSLSRATRFAVPAPPAAGSWQTATALPETQKVARPESPRYGDSQIPAKQSRRASALVEASGQSRQFFVAIHGARSEVAPVQLTDGGQLDQPISAVNGTPPVPQAPNAGGGDSTASMGTAPTQGVPPSSASADPRRATPAGAALPATPPTAPASPSAGFADRGWQVRPQPPETFRHPFATTPQPIPRAHLTGTRAATKASSPSTDAADSNQPARPQGARGVDTPPSPPPSAAFPNPPGATPQPALPADLIGTTAARTAITDLNQPVRHRGTRGGGPAMAAAASSVIRIAASVLPPATTSTADKQPGPMPPQPRQERGRNSAETDRNTPEFATPPVAAVGDPVRPAPQPAVAFPASAGAGTAGGQPAQAAVPAGGAVMPLPSRQRQPGAEPEPTAPACPGAVAATSLSQPAAIPLPVSAPIALGIEASQPENTAMPPERHSAEASPDRNPPPHGEAPPASSGDAFRMAPQPASAVTAPGDTRDGDRPARPLPVAFTAILSPTEPTPIGPAPRSGEAAGGQHIEKPQPEAPASPSAAPDDVALPPPANPVSLTPAAGEAPDDAQARWRKTPETDASAPADGSPGRLPTASLGIPEVRAAGASDAPERAAPAEPPAPAARPLGDPPAAAPKPAAAHEIQLQVGGPGNSRVEVRLTERAGDVRVAVSTPDTRLASELRADLPSLAARLEQSGFHAETWHPAATGDRQPLAEPPAGASSQDAGSQSRQDGRGEPGDPQPQEQKNPEDQDDPTSRKKQGKDFAWLLSSLR